MPPYALIDFKDNCKRNSLGLDSLASATMKLHNETSRPDINRISAFCRGFLSHQYERGCIILCVGLTTYKHQPPFLLKHIQTNLCIFRGCVRYMLLTRCRKMPKRTANRCTMNVKGPVEPLEDLSELEQGMLLVWTIFMMPLVPEVFSSSQVGKRKKEYNAAKYQSSTLLPSPSCVPSLSRKSIKFRRARMKSSCSVPHKSV